jgi:multidrug resistance efflux pump
VSLDTRALEAARSEQTSVLALRRAEVDTARARAQRAAASLAEVRQFLRFAESITDPGGISVEELTRRHTAVEIVSAELATAKAGVAAAEASVRAAESGLARITTDIARSTVTAPIDGRILQVRIRPGEFAAAGPGNPPWLVLGDVSHLHVRVDIDEHEAWRFRPDAPAVAQVRGNSRQAVDLEFVRMEPLVIPKQSLTGSSTERVDTRVLQAVYRVVPGGVRLFVGQQMDVFIESAPLSAGIRSTDPVLHR